MIRYLLDSNALSDLINKRYGVHLKVQELVKRGDTIGTCEIVIAEMYSGIENSITRDDNLKKFEREIVGIKSWPFTRVAAKIYGTFSSNLTKKGITIGRMDLLIAAITLSLPDCVIVTKDRDFFNIPDLKIVNWRDDTDTVSNSAS